MRKDSGQILTSVLIFMAFGLSVIALSATLTILNIQNTAKLAQSEQALIYAEAGAEEAILRLIRDPDYGGGNLYLVSDAVVSVEVEVNGDDRTLVSVATYNGFTKKVQVFVNLANNKVSLISWEQII